MQGFQRLISSKAYINVLNFSLLGQEPLPTARSLSSPYSSYTQMSTKCIRTLVYNTIAHTKDDHQSSLSIAVTYQSTASLVTHK